MRDRGRREGKRKIGFRRQLKEGKEGGKEEGRGGSRQKRRKEKDKKTGWSERNSVRQIWRKGGGR